MSHYTLKITSTLLSYELFLSSLQHLVLALFNVNNVPLPIIKALTPETNTEQLLPFTWSTSFEAESLLQDMNLLTGM